MTQRYKVQLSKNGKTYDVLDTKTNRKAAAFLPHHIAVKVCGKLNGGKKD